MDSQALFSYQGHTIQGVIFDLDGTLYNQKKMHAHMLIKLFLYYSIRPQKLYELRVIYYFRKKRYDAHGKENVEQVQYQIIADYLHIPVEEVRRIISLWIEESPLTCIKKCRYYYIPQLFKQFMLMNMKIAVVSDYPVKKKLEALELEADVLVCSTDSDVNAFKPDPQGFLIAAQKMGITPLHCLVIGDRDDKDGEAAKRAGMAYVKSSKNNRYIFDSF